MPTHIPESLAMIAARKGVSFTRVRYAATSRSVQPVARIGGIKVFDKKAVEKIEAALTEIEARHALITNRELEVVPT